MFYSEYILYSFRQYPKYFYVSTERHAMEATWYLVPADLIHLVMSIADLDLEVNVSLPGGLVSFTQT